MLSSNTNYFTKDNLDTYLKELAKEFRKLNGKGMPAEIILVGGAAVLANYGFRNITTDIDAIIYASSAMKDAINRVRDKFNLPHDWINTDFTRTSSYSPRLIEFSEYYRTFSNILTVRVVSAEYLIAMKLRSGRKYKNDISDIVGILAEHKKRGEPITLDAINNAVTNLYGGWEDFSTETRSYIDVILNSDNYENAYETVSEEEKHAKTLLVDFEQNYPGVTNESNVNEIIEKLKSQSSE